MVISLCFVEGISDVDTPYFATKIAQEHFFDRHEVGVIETTFYPPHYYNAIRVDADDFDFNSQVNYLRFSYLDKYYYYFIRSIEYVNETVMEIEIEMDVIQTYMFNIETHGGYIERKFIDRWVPSGSSYKINRNYIRENLSKSNLLPAEKKYTSSLYEDDLWIVFKVSEMHHADQTITYNTRVLFPLSDKPVSSSFKYVFIPLNAESLVIKSVSDGTTRTATTYFDSTYIKKISPYIVDSFIVHGFPIANANSYIKVHDGICYIYDNISALTTYANDPYVMAPLSSISSNSIGSSFCYHDEKFTLSLGFQENISNTSILSIKVIEYTCSINTLFQRSHATGNNYSSSYLPVMLDENYISYEFGNDNATTSYPLYKATYEHNGIRLQEWCNVINGSVSYFTWHGRYIDVDTDYEGDYPYYSTVVVDYNIPFYDIIVDSTNQWLIENHARIVATGLTMGKQAVRTMASAFGFSFGGGMRAPMSSFTGVGSRDMRYAKRNGESLYWDLPIKKSVRKLMQKERDDPGESIGTSGGLVSGVLKFMETGIMAAANLVQGGMQPNEVKQTGSYSDKINSLTYLTWQRTRYVNDYEQVAMYYHRNGYLVNEYVNVYSQSYNIFTYVQNRYYFNVLNLKDSDVTLINVINDESTIRAIKYRLEGGLRLWNLAPNGEDTERIVIGNYGLDNVELSALGGN